MIRDGSTPSLDPRKTLASVDHVVQVLSLLRSGHAPLHVAEVSRILEVSASTAHRLLTTLQAHGFVRQDRLSRAYLVGERLVDLGTTIGRESRLDEAAAQTLTSLKDAIDETVHLVVLRGNTSVCVACAESHQPGRTGSHVGSVFPAHRTAAGKALLANLSTAALWSLYANSAGGSSRDPAVLNWTRLRSELDAVRLAGFGTNYGVAESGVNAIAVAFAFDSSLDAAILVTVPASRVGRRQLRSLVPSLKSAAHSLYNAGQRGPHYRTVQPILAAR